MKTTRIACITTPASAATDYYRTIVPLQRLAGELNVDGITRLRIEAHDPDNIRWHHLSNTDILVTCRPNGRQYLGILAEFKKMDPARKKIWADFDDDLFNITEANPATKHFNQDEVKNTVRQALSMADVVTTSTGQLKTLYQPLTRNNIQVIPNAWNHYEQPFLKYRPQAKPVKMFWRGSATHVHDLYTIRSVMDYISHSKHMTLSMLGLERWMLPFITGDYQLEYWKTLYTYLDDLRRQRPDWLIVPLIDNAFNQGKSNIGWLEAVTVGGACIAPVGLAEWSRPGILRYESEEHLRDLVDQIARGKIRKGEYVEESRRWIEEYLRLDQVNTLRTQVIDGLMQRPAPALKPVKQ